MISTQTDPLRTTRSEEETLLANNDTDKGENHDQNPDGDMDTNNVHSRQAEHNALSVPVIRRALRLIRSCWAERKCDPEAFCVYRRDQLADIQNTSIQQFCFHFIAHKYSRRHQKYLMKKKY